MKKNSEIEESTISITQAVYETAKGLYDIGCIDKAKFSEYEEMVWNTLILREENQHNE